MIPCQKGMKQVGHLLDPGAEPEAGARSTSRAQRHRLQVALRPAGALAEQRPQLREPLLVDGRAQVLAALPAGRDQPQAEVLVLGQLVAPGPLVVGDRRRAR